MLLSKRVAELGNDIASSFRLRDIRNLFVQQRYLAGIWHRGIDNDGMVAALLILRGEEYEAALSMYSLHEIENQPYKNGRHFLSKILPISSKWSITSGEGHARNRGGETCLRAIILFISAAHRLLEAGACR